MRRRLPDAASPFQLQRLAQSLALTGTVPSPSSPVTLSPPKSALAVRARSPARSAGWLAPSPVLPPCLASPVPVPGPWPAPCPSSFLPVCR